MRFVKCDHVEFKKRVPPHKLKDLLDEFINMNCKAVRLENHWYASADSARTSINTGVKRWGVPIKVHRFNGEIYLERTDI